MRGQDGGEMGEKREHEGERRREESKGEGEGEGEYGRVRESEGDGGRERGGGRKKTRHIQTSALMRSIYTSIGWILGGETSK